MLNEFIYCPRLFYYEFVDGVFVHNADTLRGAQIHRRVDGGSGKLPPAGGSPPAATEPDGESRAAGEEADQAAAAAAELAAARERGEFIHSRSVWLSSTRLNVNAKLDLVESREAATADGRRSATPVDYKKGAPREGEDANEIWDADRMQLGLQMLVLRENGYDCAEGVIYYQSTRQRVRLPWTADLAEWIERTVGQARACAGSGVIPPPLVRSPKCVRCSLAPVCLPDETALLAAEAVGPTSSLTAGLPTDPDVAPPRPPGPVRLLMAARDERRALYLNTPGLWVGLKSERLVIKDKDKVVDEVRLRDVNHLALFGNIQLSTQAVHELCALEIPVTYFSMGSRFYGLTHGHGLRNVHVRIAQFRCAADPLASLALAKQFVHGKIRNQRTWLMRNHVEPPGAPVLRLKQASKDVFNARSADELLGMEGAAAAAYFEHFGGMIKVGSDGGAGADGPDAESWCSLHFKRSNPPPPRAPVNA